MNVIDTIKRGAKLVFAERRSSEDIRLPVLMACVASGLCILGGAAFGNVPVLIGGAFILGMVVMAFWVVGRGGL